MPRKRLEPWLRRKLDTGEIPGLEWVNSSQQMWKMPWKDNKETQVGEPDAVMLTEMARHLYKFEGDTPTSKEISEWKRKVRCSLTSIKGVEEMKDLHELDRKTRMLSKVYRFTSADEQSASVHPANRNTSNSTPNSDGNLKRAASAEQDGMLLSRHSTTKRQKQNPSSHNCDPSHTPAVMVGLSGSIISTHQFTPSSSRGDFMASTFNTRENAENQNTNITGQEVMMNTSSNSNFFTPNYQNNVSQTAWLPCSYESAIMDDDDDLWGSEDDMTGVATNGTSEPVPLTLTMESPIPANSSKIVPGSQTSSSTVLCRSAAPEMIDSVGARSSFATHLQSTTSKMYFPETQTACPISPPVSTSCATPSLTYSEGILPQCTASSSNVSPLELACILSNICPLDMTPQFTTSNSESLSLNAPQGMKPQNTASLGETSLFDAPDGTNLLSFSLVSTELQYPFKSLAETEKKVDDDMKLSCNEPEPTKDNAPQEIEFQNTASYEETALMDAPGAITSLGISLVPKYAKSQYPSNSLVVTEKHVDDMKLSCNEPEPSKDNGPQAIKTQNTTSYKGTSLMDAPNAISSLGISLVPQNAELQYPSDSLAVTENKNVDDMKLSCHEPEPSKDNAQQGIEFQNKAAYEEISLEDAPGGSTLLSISVGNSENQNTIITGQDGKMITTKISHLFTPNFQNNVSQTARVPCSEYSVTMNNDNDLWGSNDDMTGMATNGTSETVHLTTIMESPVPSISSKVAPDCQTTILFSSAAPEIIGSVGVPPSFITDLQSTTSKMYIPEAQTACPISPPVSTSGATPPRTYSEGITPQCTAFSNNLSTVELDSLLANISSQDILSEFTTSNSEILLLNAPQGTTLQNTASLEETSLFDAPDGTHLLSTSLISKELQYPFSSLSETEKKVDDMKLLCNEPEPSKDNAPQGIESQNTASYEETALMDAPGAITSLGISLVPKNAESQYPSDSLAVTEKNVDDIMKFSCNEPEPRKDNAPQGIDLEFQNTASCEEISLLDAPGGTTLLSISLGPKNAELQYLSDSMAVNEKNVDDMTLSCNEPEPCKDNAPQGIDLEFQNTASYEEISLMDAPGGTALLSISLGPKNAELQYPSGSLAATEKKVGHMKLSLNESEPSIDDATMAISIHYYGNCVMETHTRNKGIRLCYVPNDHWRESIRTCKDPEQYGPCNFPLLEFPASKRCLALTPEQQGGVKRVLEGLPRGISFSLVGSDIYACRHSNAVAFHCPPENEHFQKMERQQKVKVFDLCKILTSVGFQESLQSSRSFVRFSFGTKDPNTTQQQAVEVYVYNMAFYRAKLPSMEGGSQCADVLYSNPDEFDKICEIEQQLRIPAV